MTEEVQKNEQPHQEPGSDVDHSPEQDPRSTDQVPDAPKEESPDETPQTLETQLITVREQLLRKAADFENYKKRTEAEIQTIVRLANENLVMSILPIVDDLERSLKMGKDAEDTAAFHKGVELIYQKLLRFFVILGVSDDDGKPVFLRLILYCKQMRYLDQTNRSLRYMVRLIIFGCEPTTLLVMSSHTLPAQIQAHTW